MGFVISLTEYLKEPGVTEVQIPDCITNMVHMAIPDGVTSVVIPKSVTKIRSIAFKKAIDLVSITVSPDNPAYCDIDGVLYSKDKTVLVRYPSNRPDAEFVIPDSVTSIEMEAFYGCKNLTSITYPNNVTNIKIDTFFGCKSLASINIPSRVISIDFGAFSHCQSLASITIPSSVTSIAQGAFYGCKSLTDVYYGGSETEWEKINIEVGNEAIINATIHYNTLENK